MLLLLSFAGLPSSSTAETQGPSPSAPLPFLGGERFLYDISWLKLPAGTALLAVHQVPSSNGVQSVKLHMVARSGKVVSAFYPVHNVAESIVTVEPFLPQHMTFQRREGRRKNDFDYTFRHQDGLVTAVKDGSIEELSIPPDAQDAISCLYYVRKVLPMVPGSALTMNVHHDKKNYKLQVRVEDVEDVEGSWGKVKTARVLVIMPFQGIFLNEGNIRVWFTTDPRRVPVRMKAKVVIGSIVADLVDGFSAAVQS